MTYQTNPCFHATAPLSSDGVNAFSVRFPFPKCGTGGGGFLSGGFSSGGGDGVGGGGISGAGAGPVSGAGSFQGSILVGDIVSGKCKGDIFVGEIGFVKDAGFNSDLFSSRFFVACDSLAERADFVRADERIPL